MATINTYLNFNGNTEEAFNFYKSIFGTEFRISSAFGWWNYRMPLEKMFWGAYYRFFTDKFGVQCMVNYDFSR